MTVHVYLAADADPQAVSLLTQYGLYGADALPESGIYLLVDGSGISLCCVGEKGRVQVDFASGAAQYRRLKGGGELIAKAVNHVACQSVWDATGGLGRDSFVLASLGLNVNTFEQHPAVACLFSDGLRRAAQSDAASTTAQISLHFGDAARLMTEKARVGERPDVVYLDPMYPVRQKSAAVKKEMAYFHQLVGEAQQEAVLLRVAKAVARKRVVVKRPRLGEFLNGEKPAYQYSGKSTRFDVYLPDFPEYEAV